MSSAWNCLLFEMLLTQNVCCFREHYRNYKNSYKKTLLSPNDTELKLDLQVLEDQLGILDIVIAREHAKIEVCDRFSLVLLVEF
jgi:hypothetical protein